MNLGMYLSSMIKPELEDLKKICNFTEEEEKIFDELSRGKSRLNIAEKYSLACSTVSLRIKSISRKIEKYNRLSES